jgi:photosystem II stability/assembly factor-like uncharacterized protein
LLSPKCKIRHVSNARNGRFAYPTIPVIVSVFIVLLTSIAMTPLPAQGAAPEPLRWTEVNIPTEGAAGGWELAGGSDIRHLASAGDGTLYAYVTGLTYTLYKSTDGGWKWSHVGGVQHTIVNIAVPPDTTNIIYYATNSSVYRSVDGGTHFLELPAGPGGAGAGHVEITSLAATRLNSNIVAVGTRDTDAGEFGGVYLLDEGDIVPAWIDTSAPDYDFYAVAFSPNYNADRQIVAVGTDETDTCIINKIGNADWNAFISAAILNRDNAAIPTPVAVNGTAEIVFPSAYDADTASGSSFFYAGINTGAGEGDVYRITWSDAPTPSPATDLNCGVVYGEINTDVSGLTVYGDGSPAILLAGTTDGCRIYSSADGGSTWQKSKKEPTGASVTGVLTASDFETSGVIFAATSGAGSAISISRDMGISWNQISLIDTAITDIIDFAPSPGASGADSLFMITSGGGSGLWRSADGGVKWERILSADVSGVDSLSLVGLPPQYGTGDFTVYAAGVSNGNDSVWESRDNGQSFQCRITHEPYTGTVFSVDTWLITEAGTLYVGSFDGTEGKIYRTTNSGFSYSEGAAAGDFPLNTLALSPTFENDGAILAGNTEGWIYYSSDTGESFQPLPAEASSAPLVGAAAVAFDPDFNTNHTVYAASDNTDSGLYRFIIGRSDSWEKIDSTLPAGAVINRLAISSDGVLYAANRNPGGGMERCLNPGQASGAAFETITRGLSDTASLSGLWQRGNQFWSIDITSGRLMTYSDTLTQPTPQVSPAHKTSGIGRLGDHAIRDVTLDWETMEGATSYEWECSYNTNFSDIPDNLNGTTSASSIRLPSLEPATTYYWRARASAPVLSPWSEKWSFTTSMDIESVNLKAETPAPGAAEVSIKPVFQWTSVIGAELYDLLVATDSDFSHPVIVRAGEYALKNNVWQSDIALDYDTTYFWKVRATSAGTTSSWSSVSTFTTEPAPLPVEIPPTAEPETTTSIEDSLIDLSVPRNTQETQQVPATVTLPPEKITVTASPAPAAPSQATVINQLPDLPSWVIYLVGGLLAIVFLALVIVLAVVIKIKRF